MTKFPRGVEPLFPGAGELKKAMLRHGIDIGPMPVGESLSVVAKKLEELADKMEELE